MFKIGDRVMTYEGKGTIYKIEEHASRNNSDLFYIKLDDNTERCCLNHRILRLITKVGLK